MSKAVVEKLNGAEHAGPATGRTVPGGMAERCLVPVAFPLFGEEKKPSQYLTPIEVAEILRVTVQTVHGMIASGRLPAYRACRTRILILRADLSSCIEPIVPETYQGK